MSADLVLYNGRLATMDDQQPWATAIAIRDGRILAVGDDTTIRPLLGSQGEEIDCAGCAVTPGLVDAHVHFQWFALTMLEVDVYEVPSKTEALNRVAAKVTATPVGEWIQGRGWKNELWENSAFPTAADLDQVSPQHPVFLRDKSGHAGWANSLALQIAGIDENTPDPEGGEVQRDANGQATGMLFETAMDLVRTHIPHATEDQLVKAMRQAQQACWEVGLTGIHDFDGPACFRALQILHRNGELGLRFYKNIPAAYIDHAVALGLRSDFGDEWLRIGGVKIFADGALGPQTALMIAPYEGDTTNRGIAVTDKEDMMAIAQKAAENQLSVTIHAIGDKAVHDVLDVYEQIRSVNQTLRHRIEHVQVYHAADRNRLADLNVIASMQPKHATSDMQMADLYWGERASRSYAWRDMVDSGALVVYGSDCPVEPIDPMLGIYASITRRQPDNSYAPEGWYPEQCLSMEETIRAFTMAAAETSGQTDRLGSLTAGKLADLTIFDRDIFAVSPEEIKETKVAGTIINGVVRYRRL